MAVNSRWGRAHARRHPWCEPHGRLAWTAIGQAREQRWWLVKKTTRKKKTGRKKDRKKSWIRKETIARMIKSTQTVIQEETTRKITLWGALSLKSNRWRGVLCLDETTLKGRKSLVEASVRHSHQQEAVPLHWLVHPRTRAITVKQTHSRRVDKRRHKRNTDRAADLAGTRSA